MLTKFKLNLISKRAKEDRSCKFNNLMHLVNYWSLREGFYMLKKGKAPGVDRVTLEEYEKNLGANIENLLGRMKTMSYRPQAVRRTYVPKDNGNQRPLGIPVVEDKMVQAVFTRILEAIYEQDFMDFSYGFRRGRSCHQALARVSHAITFKPVKYVIDADIKGFFDNVNHEWMKRCIEERISDKKFVRYIVRFLKSGIVEEGKYFETEKGTPQGGIVSPILANVYLHYVLDCWFEKKLKRYCNGYVELVRYADDFLVCVQRERDTEMILKAIKLRFEKFGLELSEGKTQVVKFGRYWKRSNNDAERKTGTFNFLGFTHYCGYSRSGRFKVCRKTEKKRFTRGIKKVNNWMRIQRNRKQLKELWQMMCWVLDGHYRYYGVNDNYKRIYQFYFALKRIMYKWINRRSQKKSFSWDSFQKYLDRFPLPKPKIYNNLYKYAFYWEQQ